MGVVETDFGLYPTIAVSDGVNTACCVRAAHIASLKGRPDVALGCALVAVASGVGTLRFGLWPRQLAYWNGLLAGVGGTVGVPLIGLGFARARGFEPLPGLLEISEPFPTKVLAVLAGAGLLVTLGTPPAAAELYTTLVCVVGFGCMLLAEGGGRDNPTALAAVALFVVAGLVVGNSRKDADAVLGVLRENWFHYMLGSSMLLFAHAL
jgi:hypothetical protein